MVSVILTPTMLDSYSCNSIDNSPSENRPFQISSQSNNRTRNYCYETPIAFNKENSQDYTTYRFVPTTRSACGRAFTKLYPSFCTENEIKAIEKDFYDENRFKENHVNMPMKSKEEFIVENNEMKYSTINEFKEIDIEKLHSEINELILKRKYKQAITKLYACERFITKDKPISLRMYTK